MDLADAADVGCCSQVNLPAQRDVDHFFGCLGHDFFDTCVDDVLLCRAFQELFLVDVEASSFIDHIQKVVLGFFLPFPGHAAGAHVLQVLEPLEVAHGHSSSIAQHIRQELDSLGQADLLSLDGGWSVCGFDYNLALKPMSVVAIDGHLKCCRDEDIAE